jgi:hypothetical protein
MDVGCWMMDAGGWRLDAIGIKSPNQCTVYSCQLTVDRGISFQSVYRVIHEIALDVARADKF